MACGMFNPPSPLDVWTCWILEHAHAPASCSVNDISENAGHERTMMFSSLRNCVQIIATWGCEHDEHTDELPLDSFWLCRNSLIVQLLHQPSRWLVSEQHVGKEVRWEGPGLLWLHVGLWGRLDVLPNSLKHQRWFMVMGSNFVGHSCHSNHHANCTQTQNLQHLLRCMLW